MFPKAAAYELGARPVIYGLSSPVHALTRPTGERRLPEERLGLEEQYRFVAFDPGSARRLDWSHEREWRLAARDCPADAEDYADLWQFGLRLSSFEGIGAIVRTAEQSRRLLHDVLANVDSGVYSLGTFSFVFVRERLPTTWQGLVAPTARDAALRSARIDLASVAVVGTVEGEELIARFDAIVESVWRTAPGFADAAGELGGCWLWVWDNTAPLVRALLQHNRVVVNGSRKYLIRMPAHPDYLSLAIRQGLVTEVCRRLRAEFGLDGTYYSVLMSDDPDGAPFFHGAVWPEPYTNMAHDSADQ